MDAQDDQTSICGGELSRRTTSQYPNDLPVPILPRERNLPQPISAPSSTWSSADRSSSSVRDRSHHNVPSIGAQVPQHAPFASLARNFLAPRTSSTVYPSTNPWGDWTAGLGSTQQRWMLEDDWSSFYPGTITPTSTARPTGLNRMAQVTNAQGANLGAQHHVNLNDTLHSPWKSSLTSTISPSPPTTLTSLHSSLATVTLDNVREPYNHVHRDEFGPETKMAFNRAPGANIPRESLGLPNASGLLHLGPVPPVFSDLLPGPSSSATLPGGNAVSTGTHNTGMAGSVVPRAPWLSN